MCGIVGDRSVRTPLTRGRVNTRGYLMRPDDLLLKKPCRDVIAVCCRKSSWLSFNSCPRKHTAAPLEWQVVEKSLHDSKHRVCRH